jgi:hypothetical protein
MSIASLNSIGSMILRDNTTVSIGDAIVLDMMMLIAFATVGTDDVLLFGEKPATHQRRSTSMTRETIVVPMTIFERDVSRAADA